MTSILDRVIYGTFLSLLKLFKAQKAEEKNMTAIVSRPGVNGATRYMIGENLVFFHHFGTIEGRYKKSTWEYIPSDNLPKYTIAYFFPDDGTLMMAVAVRNDNDAYDRKMGNDLAFYRLLDGIRLPNDEEAQSHFHRLSFDEDLKASIWDEITHSTKGILSSSERERVSEFFMDAACGRKFRTVAHERIHHLVERTYYRSLNAVASQAGQLTLDIGPEPDEY